MINETILTHIKTRSPKIHSITNTITINDCANIILAAGGHATMASAPEEAAEMTSRCDGLVLNLGAVSSLDAMLAAGKEANRLRHPVVFDPVAAGATGLRRKASLQLLQELRFSAIRGNASEIHALALLSSKKRGNFPDQRFLCRCQQRKCHAGKKSGHLPQRRPHLKQPHERYHCHFRD